MRIALKNLSTGLYLKNGAVWTSDIATALQFDNVSRAQRFCTTHRLTDVEAVPIFTETSNQARTSIAA